MNYYIMIYLAILVYFILCYWVEAIQSFFFQTWKRKKNINNDFDHGFILVCVWYYDAGCFFTLKYFNIFFFPNYFLFFISTHQNHYKTLKKHKFNIFSGQIHFWNALKCKNKRYFYPAFSNNDEHHFILLFMIG